MWTLDTHPNPTGGAGMKPTWCPDKADMLPRENSTKGGIWCYHLRRTARGGNLDSYTVWPCVNLGRIRFFLSCLKSALVQHDRCNWKTTSADSMAALPKNVSQPPPPSCYTRPCATLCIPQTVLDSGFFFSLFCSPEFPLVGSLVVPAAGISNLLLALCHQVGTMSSFWF